MIDPPRTIEEALKQRYRYGRLNRQYSWFLCAWRLSDGYNRDYQCTGKPGHGPERRTARRMQRRFEAAIAAGAER